MSGQTKRERELHRLIRSEGAEVLATGFTGSGHFKTRIAAEGREKTMITAFSPSDFRAGKKIRCHVRRFVQGRDNG